MFSMFSKSSKDMWRVAGRFSSLGIEMTASVVIGMLLGRWLDNTFHSEPWGMMGGFAAGLGAGCKAVIKAVRTAQKAQQEDGNNPRTGANDLR